jgi:hypothetical protein
MSFTASILERTLVYRLWQAPFAEQKFVPLWRKASCSGVRRVLVAISEAKALCLAVAQKL